MGAFDSLYQEVILEHAANKIGSGPLDGSAGQSHQTNPTCGDEVTVGVVIDPDDPGRLQHVSWQGVGCSISQASLSMMCELVEGQDFSTIDSLWENFQTMMHSRGKEVSDDVLDPLGDAAALQGTSKFPNRIKCALLGWMALRAAIAEARFSNDGKGHGSDGQTHCCHA